MQPGLDGYLWFNRRQRLVGVLFMVLLFVCSDALAEPWRQITYEDGIRVSRKAVPGRDLPKFRGITTYNHSVFSILTVLDHVPSHTEWVHRCVDSRVIKNITDFSRIIYNRTDAPWPVADRDMVVKTQAKVNLDNRTVELSFRAVPGHVGKKDGVVRIKRLLGSYLLEILGEEKTRVTYQIDTDPGGWLPNWLINMASKQLPLHTLGNLRSRLEKVKGRMDAAKLKSIWLERLRKETGQVLTPDAIMSPPAR